MREWVMRAIDALRRHRLERELLEELRHHHGQIERELSEGGQADVTRQARMRLGDAGRITEDARDRWSIPWASHLFRDGRQAIRSLRRAPAFALTVIVTLGLGIGANAAMFEVIDRLISRPLERLRDPGAVHRVYMTVQERNGADTTSWLPFGRYQDLASETTSFSQMAAFVERSAMIGSGESARERRIAGVSAAYFEFFDAPAVRGRYFSPAEDQAPMGSPVAVLSHRFWMDAFAGADVVGQPLQIGSLSATIVGVAHAAMKGVTDTQPAAVFVPITAMGPIAGGRQAAQVSRGYGAFWGAMLVRRRDGVSPEQASADLTQAFRRSWEKQREAQPQMDLLPVERADPRAVVGGVRLGAGPSPALEVRTSRWVAAVSIVVLLIACANVGNLILARAVARQRELSVRAALGAGRARLISHAFVETLILACASAVCAAGIAALAGNAIFAVLVPAADSGLPRIGARTLVVTGILGLLVGLVLGCLPAFLAARPPLTLRTSLRGASPARQRLRSGLVMVQSALSVMLLVGAVLFVRSLEAVRAMPIGFEPDRVLVVSTVMRGVTLDAPGAAALRRQMLDAAMATPGVEAASWRTSIPLGLNATRRFFVDGVDSVPDLGQFFAQDVTSDYFKVMGTRIVRGRGIDQTDVSGAPLVVVVSRSMARTLWPDREALNQCLRFGQATSPCATVVGIAEDIVQGSLQEPTRFQYYMSLEQSAPNALMGMVLRMRDPQRDQERVRKALLPTMPGLSYLTTQPMAELVSRAQRSWALGATMFVALGGLAIVVAAIGLLGLIAYSIAQRAHELAIRAALGATRETLMRLVIGPNVTVAAAGVVTGLFLAWLARGQLQPLLFEQSASDPSAYVIVAVTLLGVAILASVIPAFRASGQAAASSLRGE